MSSTPEVRHLRHFVAVAERLHFGRAAAALHIAQPPLSRSIKDLEERLGATLLSRTRRRVELTREGERFLANAKRLLSQLESAVEEVHGMARGTRGQLRLGFVPLADYSVLPGLLRAFKCAHAGVALSLREMLSPDQAAALMAGELDLGLLIPPVVGKLEHVVVQKERFVAALPTRHRLARSSGPVRMRELAHDAFVMVPRQVAPAIHDMVLQLAARAGFSPKVSQEAIQMQTVVSIVSSGLGVALVPGSIANLGRRGVIYKELADPHGRLDVWLAWRRDARSTALDQFVSQARSYAGRWSKPPIGRQTLEAA